jgi:hypothetical protein
MLRSRGTARASLSEISKALLVLLAAQFAARIATLQDCFR